MMNIKTLIKKSFRQSMNISTALLIYVFLWGCGASRQDTNFEGDEIDIDQLLGEKEMSSTDRESEEAEVLRLLGITPEENKTQQSEVTSLQQESPQSSLQTDISKLQQDLDEKDREISTLRSQITQKESKISELESRLSSSEKRRRTSSRSNRFMQPSEDFKSKYQYALNQFNSRNYQEALSVFRELLTLDVNNTLSDNCQYWIGECYYALINYNQAIAEFEKVFSFPNSNKSDDAQLKLGICYLKLGDKQQARAEFERLLSNYPESEYIGLTQRYLSRL
ncbi:MAG: tol-pal system YbgF family protein [bacterium]